MAGVGVAMWWVWLLVAWVLASVVMNFIIGKISAWSDEKMMLMHYYENERRKIIDSDKES